MAEAERAGCTSGPLGSKERRRHAARRRGSPHPEGPSRRSLAADFRPGRKSHLLVCRIAKRRAVKSPSPVMPGSNKVPLIFFLRYGPSQRIALSSRMVLGTR